MRFNHVFLSCFGLFITISELPRVYMKTYTNNGRCFLGYPVPRNTPDAIDINSNKSHSVNLAPLKLYADLTDKVKVLNNGKLVKIILDQPSTKSSASNGVLEEDDYEFQELKYFWSLDENGTVRSTLDGKGSPIEAVAIFYNRKYGTFENSLQCRDGLAQVTFCITVGSETNERFEVFASKLKEVQTAGSSSETTLGNAILWYDGPTTIPEDTLYYSFPASYYDENTNITYNCATNINFPHYPTQSISSKQFEEIFKSFKDYNNNTLINVESLSESNSPVVIAKGLNGF